jgi:hypothetical protein
MRIMNLRPIRRLLLLLLFLSLAVGPVRGVVLLVTDEPGAATGLAKPVRLEVDLRQLFGRAANPGRLELMELNPAGPGQATACWAQFEPSASTSNAGTLWWLLPPANAKSRQFELTLSAPEKTVPFMVKVDEARHHYELFESRQPVLRYNQGTVPAPAGIDTNYARGDYLMPVHGPNGEVLTDDYPKDHPHHRGIGWSWPVTRWGNEVRDIWAVQGVWARPVAMRRVQTGPVFALFEAENVWKWGDTQPILRELVLLRVFREAGGNRFIDVELQLTALAEGVAIGGRPHGGYGGFGLRAAPAQERVITRHTDPPTAATRRSWLDYSGIFAGGRGPAGLAILEHVSNLFYPNELKEYPELNYVMPAFPGEREVPLSKDKPLILKHRLWIHQGKATPDQLAEVWAAYASPPRAQVQQKNQPERP